MSSLGNMPEWTQVAKVCELPAVMHFIHGNLAIRGTGAPEHGGSRKNWRQTRAVIEKRSLKELAGKQPTNISYRNSSSFLRQNSFIYGSNNVKYGPR